MLASNNIPETVGRRPVTLPTQEHDHAGLHHLTTIKEGGAGEGRAFSSIAEAILAKDQGSLDLTRSSASASRASPRRGCRAEGFVQGSDGICSPPRSVGGHLQRALPVGLTLRGGGRRTRQDELDRHDLAERYPKVESLRPSTGSRTPVFYWATRSGVTGRAVRRHHAEGQARDRGQAQKRAARSRRVRQGSDRRRLAPS